MIVAPGSTSVSIDVFFADDSGFAVTGKVAADFPTAKWSSGSNTADTTITLSDLVAITTAHPNDNTAGGIKEREGGWYRLDLPNNMFTSAGRKIVTFAETTNKRILAPTLDVQYVQGDIQTIKTQTVACSGSVTIPAATLASTTNITAGTITTSTNLTNAATSGDFTATMKTSIGTAVAASAVASVTGDVSGKVLGGGSSTITGTGARVVDASGSSIATASALSTLQTTANTISVNVSAIPTNPYTGTPPTVAQIATGVWQDTTSGDFTVGSSIGKGLFTGVLPGASGGLLKAGVNAATTYNDNFNGTLAAVTGGTDITFPTTDASGNSIPDDTRYEFCIFQLVGGTGSGQLLFTTNKAGTRKFNYYASATPVNPSTDTTYRLFGSWRQKGSAALLFG